MSEGSSPQPGLSTNAIGLVDAFLIMHPGMSPEAAAHLAGSLLDLVGQSLVEGREVAFVRGLEVDAATGQATAGPEGVEIQILVMPGIASHVVLPTE